FTADNFFHQDQFSGSGGWMGLNRSWPLLYAASAKKVLDANPEWILAEHGGPYEFNAEDFRRRAQWGEACAKAADAICVSGNHRRDWDPYRVQIAPILHKIKPGNSTKVTLMVASIGVKPEKIVVSFAGRGLTADQNLNIETIPGKTKSQEITLKWADAIPPGRHVFPLRIVEADAVDDVDAFFAVVLG